jgi:hypothetical protein
MMQDFVLDLVVIQTVDELFRYFHQQLPQWKVSLSRAISTFQGTLREAVCLPTNPGRAQNVISGRENQAKHRRKGDGARTVYVWLHAKFAKMNMTRRLK